MVRNLDTIIFLMFLRSGKINNMPDKEEPVKKVTEEFIILSADGTIKIKRSEYMDDMLNISEEQKIYK